MALNGKRARSILLVVAATAAAGARPAAALGRAERHDLGQLFAHLPLSFEPNQGQADAGTRFLTRSHGYTVFLEATAAVVELPDPPLGGSRTTDPAGYLRIEFVGANRKARASAAEPLPGKSHYFVGNDPARWRTGIPHYARIRYQDAYPGIDVVFYSRAGQLEYDFVVAPGGDPGLIALAFKGADRLEVDDRGDLVLHTAAGPVRMLKPLVYQQLDGERRPIAGSYVVRPGHPVRFQVAAYDRRRPLVIDPILAYSTYLPAGFGQSLAVDPYGNTYLMAGAYDVGVMKINAAGDAIVYSTQFGGDNYDYPRGIAVDIHGNAHVTGATRSQDFPTANAFRATCAFNLLPLGVHCEDAFITKLNATGDALVYSTFVGGTGEIDPGLIGGSDNGVAIAVDPAGNAYMAGNTNSPNLPTGFCSVDPPACGVQTDAPSAPFHRDAFFAKVRPNGGFFYLSYLGGGRDDEVSGIAADTAGHAFIVGTTRSLDFPVTLGAFQAACVPDPMVAYSCTREVFVAKVLPFGFDLAYGTFLAGGRRDEGRDVAVDVGGNAYVTGFTRSADFPVTPGALDVDCGIDGDGECDPDEAFGGFRDDAFVAKLTADGSGLVYATYLGDGEYDRGVAIALDGAGRAHVTGTGLVPGSLPLPSTTPDVPGTFMTRLAADGSAIDYSLSISGDNGAAIWSLALDGAGHAYVSGFTSSLAFPTHNALYPAPPLGTGSPYSVTAKLACSLDSYAIAPTWQGFGPGGGTGTVSVPAPAACGWTASTSASWITLTASGGGGAGTVSYAVAANPGGSRWGTIAVAGQTFTVAQLGIPDLSVTMTDAPDPAFVGDDLGYFVKVTNRGPSTATGVVLTHDLPLGVTFLSATPSQGSCTRSYRRVTCALGTMANGSVVEVTTVVVPGSAGKYGATKLTSSASVAASEPDPNTSNNRASAVTTVSRLY